jgi:WD40 repeat protein
MRLLVHDSGVIEVAYSASGEEVVAACGNGDRAYMRRRGSGYEVATREKSPFAVAARFTRDLGSSVIATPARPRLSALQRGNPKPLWTHEVDGLRREFELSADERVVTIVAEIDEQRRYARTYDTLSGTSGAETPLPDRLNYAAVVRGGRGVIGQTTNGISILDFATDKVDEVKYSQPFTTSALAFSSKSLLYAAGTTRGEVLILSAEEARPLWSHAVSDNFILALAFSADDRLLAASCLDGTVTVIHLASRQVLATHQLYPLKPVRLCFSPDSTELACGLWGNEFLGRDGVIVLNLGFGAPR